MTILLDGRLWEGLTSNIPALSSLQNPWQNSEQYEQLSELFQIRVIAALAKAFLHPGDLVQRNPYRTTGLASPCLIFQSNEHQLAGSALRLSGALILTQYITKENGSINYSLLQKAASELIQKKMHFYNHALTTAQLAEARRRRIPTFAIDLTARLYQFGTGIHSRLVRCASNDHDSAIGVAIAKNKGAAHDLISQLGFRVPKEKRLSFSSSDEKIRAAAKLIGYPCVMKPIDAEQGKGVTPNILNDEELARAAKEARKYTREQLLLQQHIAGNDYRLNVIGGRLVFAVRRIPPSIVGDGCNTVKDLITALNIKQRSLKAQGQIAGEIDLSDPEVIGMINKVHLTPTSIPRLGEKVLLRRNANVSTGGGREEIEPSSIHPVIHRECKAIARTFGLEVCGIDYITTDITQSPEHTKGAYIEVNAMPENSAARASLLIGCLFPEGQTHSISTTVIVGEWSSSGIQLIKKSLEDVLVKNPDASIGIPRNIYGQIVALLENHIKTNAHVYAHPREMLLNKANKHVVFVLDSTQAWNRGLPSITEDGPLNLILCGSLEEDNSWQELLLRHE